MKKQIQKLRLNKSKVAHFQTLYLKGGTQIPTTLPLNNTSLIVDDCPIDTLTSPCGTYDQNGSCDTRGRLRTKNTSPCGNTKEINSENNCTNGNMSTEC